MIASLGKGQKDGSSWKNSTTSIGVVAKHYTLKKQSAVTG